MSALKSIAFAIVFICPLGAYCQARAPFLDTVVATTLSGKAHSSIKLNGTAEWTAGSQQESGNAQMEAHSDGSMSLSLGLQKATRTETHTKTEISKTCEWTDASGASHAFSMINCLTAIPWFAPILFSQSAATLPQILSSVDHGEVTKNDRTLHEITFSLNIDTSNKEASALLSAGSGVKVFYDPKTLLPATLEYNIHADDNALVKIPVRVEFSDYRSDSGVMLPYHIERFVANSLELKLDFTSASIQ